MQPVDMDVDVDVDVAAEARRHQTVILLFFCLPKPAMDNALLARRFLRRI